jgi:hypothetical protein
MRNPFCSDETNKPAFDCDKRKSKAFINNESTASWIRTALHFFRCSRKMPGANY